MAGLGLGVAALAGCPRSSDVRAQGDASAIASGASSNVSATDAADALQGIALPEGMTRARLERCKVRAVKCEPTGGADAAACRPQAEIQWNDPALPVAWGTIPFSPRPTQRARANDPKACCYVDFFCPNDTTPAASCAELTQAFRRTWKQAPGTCATDNACGCYNPVVEESGCGGVTDSATAATLAGIEKQFHAASCPWPHACAAQACNPQCAGGRCINRLRPP